MNLRSASTVNFLAASAAHRRHWSRFAHSGVRQHGVVQRGDRGRGGAPRAGAGGCGDETSEGRGSGNGKCSRLGAGGVGGTGRAHPGAHRRRSSRRATNSAPGRARARAVRRGGVHQPADCRDPPDRHAFVARRVAPTVQAQDAVFPVRQLPSVLRLPRRRDLGGPPRGAFSRRVVRRQTCAGHRVQRGPGGSVHCRALQAGEAARRRHRPAPREKGEKEAGASQARRREANLGEKAEYHRAGRAGERFSKRRVPRAPRRFRRPRRRRST